MLKIEFLKILKRKYNYIYFLVSTIILLGLTYSYERICNYLNITSADFIYSYLYKVVLVFSMIIAVVNLVRSYREDYYTGVYKILKNANVSYFNSLFSKVLTNFTIFSLTMITKIAVVNSYLHFFKGIEVEVFLNEKYFILVLVMLMFTVLITLFVLSMFNDSNIALSLVLLFFLGSKYLAIYLVKINEIFINIKYTFLGVYNEAFELLGSTMSVKNFYEIIISLLVNCLILFILSLAIKLIKKK